MANPLFSADLLSQPFAWIEIPHKGYSIAKYPVTNSQFKLFMDAGGYGEKRWWTDAGWDVREKGLDFDYGWVPSGIPWTEPRYWQSAHWNGAEQPVVGVSWYEAVAFCLWLSALTGEKIMLPTEDQWQYAAQGDDGREYPWGNAWDCEKCNNSVPPCTRIYTTPVRHYEGKGDSPFGVVDMAGNIWEWCLNDFENKTNAINDDAPFRMLRGGSYSTTEIVDDFRCAARLRSYPYHWSDDRGFRLALFSGNDLT